MATIPDVAPKNILTLTQALMQAEAQARSTLPVALHERLSAAVSLVREGRVFQDSAGAWQVDSTTRTGLTYSVNGVCQCDDHHYNKPPRGLCKHRLAMFLSQRVLSLMAQPPAPVLPVVPVEPWPDNDPEQGVPTPQAPPVVTEPVPPVPALPEAAFSLTLKGHMAGVDALLTIRGQTAADFQANIAAVRGLLDAPQPAPSQGPSQGQGKDWCLKHQAQMKWNAGKNGRKGWYSHKTEDGQWCQGR